MRQSVFRTRWADHKGFTIIELLITMAIAGMVMGAIYSIFISSNRSYRTQDNVADAQQRVRVGIDFIAHDLRMAGLDPLSAGAGIENATSVNLRFTSDLNLNGQIDNDTSGLAADLNRERVTYNYDATSQSLRRKLYQGTPNETAWQPLIDGVSALAFVYRDVNGNVTAVLDDIRMVDITMTCQARDAQGQFISRTLSTRVNLRN